MLVEPLGKGFDFTFYLTEKIIGRHGLEYGFQKASENFVLLVVFPGLEPDRLATAYLICRYIEPASKFIRVFVVETLLDSFHQGGLAGTPMAINADD